MSKKRNFCNSRKIVLLPLIIICRIMDRKIEFLYAAIADAQELIKFIDTKTAVVIGVVTAFVIGLFSCYTNVLLYACSFSCCFWVLLCFVLVFLLLSIWTILKIIKPINNPKDNIHLDDTDNLPLNFYIPSNKYSNVLFPFFNSRNSKLSENFKSYIEKLKNISDNDIVNILTYELFKISYIRNIKNDRFKVLVWFVLILTVLFVVFYGTYNFEMKNIIDSLKNNL